MSEGGPDFRLCAFLKSALLLTAGDIPDDVASREVWCWPNCARPKVVVAELDKSWKFER